jgi:hypothetical protein
MACQVIELRARLERHNLYSARDRVRDYLAAGANDNIVVLPGTVKDLAGELGLTTKPCIARSPKWRWTEKSHGSKGKIRFLSQSYERDYM